jgi:UDP-N-acetylmuramate dehydrogenase
MIDLIADFDLSARNTLALKARSRFGTEIVEAAQVPALLDLAAERDLPLRILGGGSNVVLSEAFDGITAVMSIAGRRVLSDVAEATVIEAGAGEGWSDLVAWTVGQGFGGLENLVSIPGTIGAAPVQNIGAYGAELADFFLSLTAYDRHERRVVEMDRDLSGFGYRDSAYKRQPDRYVITSVRLRLPKTWVPNLRFAGLSELADKADLAPIDVMNKVAAIRASKLPDWRVEPNAGSFFQNPVVTADQAAAIVADFPEAPNFAQPDGRRKLSAAWLIEKSGLKGFQLGHVGTSERHALVVVNRGGASASDIAGLADHIKAEVLERFGVALHVEPIFL